MKTEKHWNDSASKKLELFNLLWPLIYIQIGIEWTMLDVTRGAISAKILVVLKKFHTGDFKKPKILTI